MPIWEGDKWNKDKNIRKTHNCYMYAMNEINTKYSNNLKMLCMLKKKCFSPQPGMRNGMIDITGTPFTKQTIEKYIKLDYPSFKKFSLKKKLPINFYRIAIFLKKDFTDYHFYRQDNNGLWSHKDGWRNAKNKDINGKMINNVIKANTLYEKYPIFLGYYIKSE